MTPGTPHPPAFTPGLLLQPEKESESAKGGKFQGVGKPGAPDTRGERPESSSAPARRFLLQESPFLRGSSAGMKKNREGVTQCRLGRFQQGDVPDEKGSGSDQDMTAV